MTTTILLYCSCDAEIEVLLEGNRQHVRADIVRRDCTCKMSEERQERIQEEALETYEADERWGRD